MSVVTSEETTGRDSQSTPLSHTPGPWEAPRLGHDGAVYAPNAPKGTLWRICDGIRGLDEFECAGNARLIAAAPALLDLAHEALKVLEPIADCDPAVRAWIERYTRIVTDVVSE